MGAGRAYGSRRIWAAARFGGLIWHHVVGYHPDLNKAIQRLEMLGVNRPTSVAVDFDGARRRVALKERCAC